MSAKSIMLVSVILLGLLTSCSNEHLDEYQGSTSIVKRDDIQYGIRSIDVGREVALQAIETFGFTGSKASPTKHISSNPIIISEINSRSEETPMVYIFNYDDNEGFSVVSASTNTAPLIAYVEDGHYDIDYSNDGFILYMNSAIEYVRKSYTNNTYYIGDMPVRTKTENVFVTTDEVKPKIEVNCGPTQWEGYYCPNSDAGSLAIAVAQILSYYEHPSWVEDYEPQYEYPGGPPLLKYLDWEDLKKHSISKHDTNFAKPGQQFISCNASNESHKALSCICREIADRCGSNYTSEGTFVSSPDIPNVFLNYFDQCAYHLFAYNEEAHNYDLENSNSSFASKELLSVDDAISDLSSGFLILYSVNKNDQLYYWAADGYKVVDIVANVYVEVKKDNMWGTQWELLESHKTGEAQFIHINWGDYGRCNGYFLFTDIHPEAGIEYDNSKLDSWCNNYVMNNKIRIYGINIEIL